MGGQYATPGKTTAAQGASSPAANQYEAQGVGKQTLVAQQYGSQARDIEATAHGVFGATTNTDPLTAPGSDENYPPGYREKLERLRADRVNAALTSAQRALGDLRVDTLLQHVDEVPWWASIIMGLVLTQLGNAISAGIGALKNATNIPAAVKLAVPEFEGSMADAVASANESAGRWAKKEAWLAATRDFRALAAHHIEDLSKRVVDGVTRPVTIASVAGAFNQDSPAQRDKDNAIGYTDMLSDGIMLRFQAIREQAPKRMNIAELVADTKGWSAEFHLVSHYHAVFHEMVTRYVGSNVSKIGRDQTWDGPTSKHVEREIRVAWLLVPGAGKRLVYMDRVFSDWYQTRMYPEKALVPVERSPAYDSGQNQLSLQETGTWSVSGHAREHRELPLRADQILNYVEPEFVELAQAKHKKVWLTNPEVFQMDYTQPVAPGVPAITKVAGA